MWFKNLKVYQITKAVNINPEALSEILAEGEFKPCEKSQSFSVGWYQPLGKNSELFTHTSGHHIMICQRTEEKIIPSSAINQKIQEKIEIIEERESRKVTRHERNDIKYDVIAEALPNALSRTTLLYAYIDTKNSLFIIDSASSKRCEELISHLRQMLGSFPVVPLTTQKLPIFTMTTWLLNKESPDLFAFGSSCTLKSPLERSNVVKFSHHNIFSDEVNSLLADNMSVTEVAFEFDEKISFTLDEHLTIKKLKFSDIIKEQTQDSEDAIQQFDIDFTLMVLEVQRLIKCIIDRFGGLQKDTKSEEQLEITGLNGGCITINEPNDVEQALAEAFEDEEEDDLYNEAYDFVIETQKSSISSLQRKLRIGYNRAARLIERMEYKGVVSEMSSKGVRLVIVDKSGKLSQ